jgi:hypothetical protein
MVRAYLNVRATGGAVFSPLRGENTRERWSTFKGEGDGGCSKKIILPLEVLRQAKRAKLEVSLKPIVQ